jgi:hypothetical protein
MHLFVVSCSLLSMINDVYNIKNIACQQHYIEDLIIIIDRS